MLSDQPLRAVPVEALGGVSDAGKVHAGFMERNGKKKINSMENLGIDKSSFPQRGLNYRINNRCLQVKKSCKSSFVFTM